MSGAGGSWYEVGRKGVDINRSETEICQEVRVRVIFKCCSLEQHVHRAVHHIADRETVHRGFEDMCL